MLLLWLIEHQRGQCFPVRGLLFASFDGEKLTVRRPTKAAGQQQIAG